MIRAVSTAIAALMLVATMAPAMAADAAAPTTKSACKKAAGMHWDTKTKTCMKN